MKYFNINDREFFEERLQLVAECDSILDIGSGMKFQKQLKGHQGLFNNKKYISLDINPEVKPDIVGDIHKIPAADNYFDAVICHSVLEHAANPFVAVNEIYRILKPGGPALIYLPFFLPYHGNKDYLDYWRFSKDGVAELFKKFSLVEICPLRRFFEMWLNLLPLLGNYLSHLGRLLDFLLISFKPAPNQVAGWYVFLRK